MCAGFSAYQKAVYIFKAKFQVSSNGKFRCFRHSTCNVSYVALNMEIGMFSETLKNQSTITWRHYQRI